MEGILSLILTLVLLAIGVLLCFSGYRSMKPLVMIYVFVTGFLFMYNLLSDAFPELGQKTWAISLVTGVVLAVIAGIFIKFCIFIVGGIAGLFIFRTLSRYIPALFAGSESSAIILYGVIFFVVCGALTLLIRKHLIIIFTAFAGAETLVTAFGMFMGLVINPGVLRTIRLDGAVGVLENNSIFTGASSLTVIIPVIAFTIAGILAQYKITGRRRRKR